MIWLLEYREPIPETALFPYLPLLDDERRQRLTQFRSEKARTESILAGLLLRCAYAQECGGPMPEIVCGAQGKPAFADAAPQFSLSHCRGAVACALSHFPVGVDVQHAKHYDAKFRRILSEPERAWIEQADENARFTALWTRKEAYGKALGCGIGYDMKVTQLAGEFAVPTAYDGWLLWTIARGECMLSCCAKEALALRGLTPGELLTELEERL